ncbi:MAG: SDR family oxidoreductase [Bacteroidetes bacterium]|nr:SDR family oxidoreductase [Bacteroidota bacterium]
MKKILITGSNGLLGQKIVYSLLLGKNQGRNVEIVATSKGENRITARDGYTFETFDITDREETRKIINGFEPDCIINTAAMTNVDACETKKEECWADNVSGVRNLADMAEMASITFKRPVHLIHLSTDFIFDGKNGPYREDAAANPLSYYALSKYESEKIVMKSRAPWTIIRTIIIYGVADNMSRTNIVLWAKNSLENNQHIRVVSDQYRAPTLAEDLAEGCIAAAMKEATGIYHVSGKDIMSILEMVYKICDFWNLDKSLITPVNSAELNQPAKRPPRTGFILDKAIRELSYEPHSFVKGLKVVDEQLKLIK